MFKRTKKVNVVLYNGTTTWTVPADWNNSNNSIECIGGGGAGKSSVGGGGGGGAYARKNNVTLSPGALTIQIGAGGAASGGNGTDTFFNGASCAAATVCAKAGSGASGVSGGAGGLAAPSSIGDITFAGGAGGDGDSGGQGAGGGGAGGPNGAGKKGGDGAHSGSDDGGGGGGGNGGGTVGQIGGPSTGGNGGNNWQGFGGGNGISSGTGNPGKSGGGGGGNAGSGTAGAGGNGTDINGFIGGGGGGGGGGYNTPTNKPGGAGGLYGGGGGGGGDNTPSTGGAGAPGVCVITYASNSVLNVLLELFAGNVGGEGDVDGTGTNARFHNPQGIGKDSSGNMYISDSTTALIRKMTTGGVVSPFVGGLYEFDQVDATGSAARLLGPAGIVGDASGNIYFADSNTIRKITSAGVVTTFAGSQTPGYADGTGTSAEFNYPTGLAIDSSGNIFVADNNNHTIRKITSAGVVTTFAGQAENPGFANGTGTAAIFNGPRAIAIDSSNNLFVTDTNNHKIRRITSAGVVTTFAGAASGSSDGTGTAAKFDSPIGITIDGSNNLYVSDSENLTIRKITSGAVVTTLAGSVDNEGIADGTGTAARFTWPTHLVFNGTDVYVLDGGNGPTVRKVTTAGVVTTFAGSRANPGMVDATGAAARFTAPSGIAIDSSGNTFVADSGNQIIRKITPAGVVTTFAGQSGVSGHLDATGTAALFSSPERMVIDSSDNLYVYETGNYVVRKITPAGVVTTLAGQVGTFGHDNGTGTAATFYYNYGMAIDSSGNIFVSDTYNQTIRKITPAGVVTIFAGQASVSGNTDGTGTAATFTFPVGIAIDGSDNIYVADLSSHLIRKITPGAVVTTFAGQSGVDGYVNGTGAATIFKSPKAMAADPSTGNIYVFDENWVIRKITPAGVASLAIGNPGRMGVQPGTLPASLGDVYDMTFKNNSLYITTPNGVLKTSGAP